MFPGGVLELIWKFKPEAREAFETLGVTSIALMTAVAVACAGAAIGLWQGMRWGHRLAMLVLAINLVGDGLNATLGRDPRAWIGVPITALLLAYLSRRQVRRFFAGRGTKPGGGMVRPAGNPRSRS